MTSSSFNLFNNLSEVIHKFKCKYRHDNKRCKTSRIKYKCCNSFLEYRIFKDDLIEYKYLFCNKNYQLDEKVKERFFNTYNFSNYSSKKFISLLQKGVYPNKYLGDSKKSNETSLPEKEDFYSHLNIEDITDADYA